MPFDSTESPVGAKRKAETISPSLNNFGSGDQFNARNGHQYINSGSGTQYIHSYVTENHNDGSNDRHHAALWVTDPRNDKARIVSEKDKLVPGSFEWILGTNEFRSWQEWRHDDEKRLPNDPRLLWIKGDPGKGKTMLLCSLIDKLLPTTKLATENAEGQDKLFAFFFCQASDSRLNTNTAVLRSLIWVLVQQKPSLLSVVRAQCVGTPCQKAFEGSNGWYALKGIFFAILRDILSDEAFNETIFIVDALDECISGRNDLLDLITTTLSTSAKVKWIISSRNWHEIEERLNGAGDGVQLSLELNEGAVSKAVQAYVKEKAKDLEKLKGYDEKTHHAVHKHLSENANGTFLWVALVFQGLAGVDSEFILDKLDSFPPQLEGLYGRMMDKIKSPGKGRLNRILERILCLACTVSRPLIVDEVCAFLLEPRVSCEDSRRITGLIQRQVSFLALREENGMSTAYFIHQSAKDYLMNHATARLFPLCPTQDGNLFPLGPARNGHLFVFRRSLQILGKQLRRDIYGLHRSGIRIQEITSPDPDPLVSIKYSCVYWVQHLEEAYNGIQIATDDCNMVYEFLKVSLLHWLEALSLLRQLPQGIRAMKILSKLFKQKPDLESSQFIQDAARFVLYHGPAIEEAPLQVYVSALLFSPHESIVRRQFWSEEPIWVVRKPHVEDSWGPCLQTLRGHERHVNGVAWSPDGRRVVSCSDDRTLRIWDVATGSVLQRLTGHDHVVTGVDWSPDGQHIVSGSEDDTIRIWDAETGSEIQERRTWASTPLSPRQRLEENKKWRRLITVAWSPDGRYIASGSRDQTIKIFRFESMTLVKMLTGQQPWLRSKTAMVWLPESSCLVAASDSHAPQVQDGTQPTNQTVNIWDVEKELNPKASVGQQDSNPKVLKGHEDWVESVACSINGRYIATGSADNTIKIWDSAQGSELLPLRRSQDTSTAANWSLRTTVRMSDSVRAVGWSPDNRHIVSGSSDCTISIWDTEKSSEIRRWTGHRGLVTAVAWSPTRRYVLSSSTDGTIKIWDAEMGSDAQPGSMDEKSKIQYTAMRSDAQTLKEYSDSIRAIVWSPDHHQIMTILDGALEIWDAKSGSKFQTIITNEPSRMAAAWSPDGRSIASSASDGVYFGISVWDVDTGCETHKLIGQTGRVNAIAWSPNGQYIISVSARRHMRIWDTKACPWVTCARVSCYRATCSWATCSSVTCYGVPRSRVPGTRAHYSRASRSKAPRLRAHFSRAPFPRTPCTTVSCSWVIHSSSIADLPTVTCSTVRYMRAPDDSVTTVAWSPDGQHIISGSHKHRNIIIWGSETTQTIPCNMGPSNITFKDEFQHIVAGLDASRMVSSLSETNDVRSSTPLAGLGFGISADREWIMHNGARLIKLPLDYQPPRTNASVVTATATSLAWICDSNRLCIIEFGNLNFRDPRQQATGSDMEWEHSG